MLTREMLRATNTYNLGVGYQRVLDGLERVGEIEQRTVKGSKNLIRYVRLAVGESHEV